MPPFKYVADVSIKVAEAVAKKAQEQDLARAKETDRGQSSSDLSGIQSINNSFLLSTDRSKKPTTFFMKLLVLLYHFYKSNKSQTA